MPMKENAAIESPTQDKSSENVIPAVTHKAASYNISLTFNSN